MAALALTHEFYYNREHAQKFNPRLMGIGTTGGFGCTRAAMIKCVKYGDIVKAEQHFWELVIQTLEETKQEEDVIGIGSFTELMNEWFSYLNKADTNTRMFIRPRVPGSTFEDVINTFILRHWQDGQPI